MFFKLFLTLDFFKILFINIDQNAITSGRKCKRILILKVLSEKGLYILYWKITANVTWKKHPGPMVGLFNAVDLTGS